MKLGKWLKRIALALSTLVVLYVVVGIVVISSISQREETWHDEAVQNSKPATRAEWFAEIRNDHPRIELRYRPKHGLLYRVRIYENRSYVSELFPGSSDGPPTHMETGSIGMMEWRALQKLAEEMHPVRASLFQPDDNMNPADMRLTIVHDNRQRALYKYHTANYAQLPQLLRDYDALLFRTMASWHVKPHHGHARTVPGVDYGVETIPNLVRGLESPREALYATVVQRLVNIGEPALPALVAILREGEQARYLPVSRYAAVVDGIGQLADSSSEGYTLVKALADGTAATSGQKALRQAAQDVVDRFDIEAYLAGRWAVSPQVETLFADRSLAPEQAAEAMSRFRYQYNLRKPGRDSASDVLIETGPAILPFVLEQLRRERIDKNLINEELLQALGALGGYQAFLFAIQDDVVSASACVPGMRDLGVNGMPGLLALLESGERYARHQAADALSQPEYASYSPQFGAELEDKLRAFREMAPGAVRDLKQDGAIRLIDVIRVHGAPEAASLRAVVAAATDEAQHDRTRIAALEALGRLGPRAATAAPQLRAMAGYSSGRVYETLEETLAAISRQN